ncbi:hypothetical protein WR25_10706 [Diploscapter pachys]|uniref:Uncharacterized protein n=1 Tax=Diploscapter pachys TaxID=2018661 RepID=A0A2A2M5X9_9BILA|nr:hypothetical protein WR25_10706 [Diploscapter pachys]
MLDREAPRQVITQRLHAVALGGVMAGGDEADAVFAGTVKGLLRCLATEEQVDSGGNGCVDVALPASAVRAPVPLALGGQNPAPRLVRPANRPSPPPWDCSDPAGLRQ